MKTLSKQELESVYGGSERSYKIPLRLPMPLSPPPIPGAIHIDIKPSEPSLPKTIPNPWIIF